MTELPNFYEANMALLKKHHPHIWATIDSDSCEPMGEIFLSPNGQPNIKIVTKEGKEVALHDLNQPASEVRQSLNSVPEESTGMIVLIGMGLGYILIALLQQRPKIRHVAVFDLEPGVFKQALRVMDFSSALTDRRLILSLGSHPNAVSVLAPANKALQLEIIHRLRHLPSFRYNESGYQELDKEVFEFINDKSVAGATDQRFGKMFINNRLSLLNSIHHNFLLEGLQGRFAGIPAILVAGGPSLDKNIHLLPKIKDKAIIIGVDAVLPALLAQGVSPHFITSIDPQKLTYEKIADSADQIKDVSLIAAPYVTPEVHKIFPASNIFWTFSKKSIESWINSMLEGKILTSGSSTCAHLNLTAAIMMGCSPIIYIGQDLAFPGYRDHAAGVVLSDPDLVKKELSVTNQNAIWLDGVNGGKVPSHRGFLTSKNHFEYIMASNPGPHYINATEGGALIAGTEVLPLQEVIDRYCSETIEFPSRLHTALQDSNLSNTKKLLSGLNKALNDAKSLSKTVNKYDKLIHSILHYIRSENNNRAAGSVADLPIVLQNKISNVEALEKKMDNTKHLYIWQILGEGTMEDVKESERSLHEITTLARQSENFIPSFTKNLERLLSLNKARKNILAMFQHRLLHIVDFQRKEKKILKKIEQKKNVEPNLFELAQFYFETGNFVLAQPVLEKLLALNPDSAEVLFYSGVIAARQSKFGESEEYFQKAQEADTAMSKRVLEFRRELGDIYFDLAGTQGDKIYSNVSRKMLFKGIRYCSNHSKIKQEIIYLAESDLTKIKSALESDSINDVETILTIWHKGLEENKNLARCITDDQTAGFHRHYGDLLLTNEDLDGALKSMQAALKFTPDNPDLYATAAGLFFAMQDFTNGITHLNKAVELDRSYAILWENMGDHLHQTGEINDAIAAYEQGVIAIPENINLLKKIGDCYLGNGQLEAAREVYKMVKEKYDLAQPPRT